MTLAEPLKVTLIFVKVLKELRVSYLVGGSIASSLHGLPRSTQDVDLVADLEPKHVALLVERLEKEFYIDADMILDAIQRHSSFNVIYLPTMLKIDVFIPRDDAFSSKEMERRQSKNIGNEELVVASAEDIVLEKLRCFKLGQGISDRQWNDVRGVLKVQANMLDIKYLRKWATEIGVADLLEKEFEESGLELKNS